MGETTKYQYDAADQRTAVTNPKGESSRTVYDPAGRVESMSNGLGLITLYEYDKADRQTAVTNPAGETSRTEYDAAGQVVATSNGLARLIEPFAAVS